MTATDFSVAGDADRWILLERSSADELPIVVRARLNPEIEEYAKSGTVIAVICDVRPEFVRDNGMPTCMTELYDLEDEIVARVADLSAKVFHSASATGDARRVIYFVGRPCPDIAPLVEDISTTIGIVSIADDIDSQVYWDFVSPTNFDKQIDGDRQVIAALEEHGDQLEVPREVEFFFYGERSKLELLVRELGDQGFRLNSWLDESGGILLNRTMSVETREFNQLTPVLLEVSDRLQITYDGWGSPMANSPTPQPEPDQPKPSLLSKLFGAKKN